MTCPRCRLDDRVVELDFAAHESIERAVEEKLTLRCPACGWTEVYSL